MYASVGCTKVMYVKVKDRLYLAIKWHLKNLCTNKMSELPISSLKTSAQRRKNLATGHYITHLGNLCIVPQ